jgi:hypothetical protein
MWMRMAVTAALMAGTLAHEAAADEADWQQAVATLSGERTRAETCVRVLKRHGAEDAARISRGELAYGEAKADMDAVISRLITVLAQKEDIAFEDIEAQLTQGVAAREGFCEMAVALIPADDAAGTKTKDGIVGAVGGVIGTLIGAAKDIYIFESKAGQLERRTVQTQLEGTKWDDFSAISP